MPEYIPTIGIECHVQLKTKTKLFSAVSNDAREAEPNTTISPICLGLPGVLPVLNEKAVELAIRAGLALNGQVAERMKFDRKHYFYPDLPKGYQITQYDEPIILSGLVEVPLENKTLRVRIERAHLEEDAGKSIHPPGADYTLVDLNRAGTPLLEIVSAPDMHGAREAKAYARELYLLMKYADVSDVDLYHGNMRFDVNVSLAPAGSKKLGVRTEVKNLNSFRAVEKAVNYETRRQTELLDKGKPVVQETRGWDEAKQKTTAQRTKEEAHDYRYFPEPDIPPIRVDKSEVKRVAKTLARLPYHFRVELAGLGIPAVQSELLIEHPAFIKSVAAVAKTGGRDAGIFFANLITNVWLGSGRHKQFTMTLAQAIELHGLFSAKKLSSTNAKQLFLELQGKPGQKVADFAKKQGLLQLSDGGELEKLVRQAIKDNPQAASAVKKGELKAIGFLVGQVMKLSGGQANPQKVRELIKKELG